MKKKLGRQKFMVACILLAASYVFSEIVGGGWGLAVGWGVGILAFIASIAAIVEITE